MPETKEISTIPSVKDLASSEPSIRRKCLEKINEHLSSRSASDPLTPIECLQLWRGLYVAVYMYDSKKATAVQTLVASLAGFVVTMREKDLELDSGSVCIHQSWLESWSIAFWETICREWVSIDQWRMNKVLLLVRFFLREVFSVSLQSEANKDSDSKSVRSGQIQIFEAWPLSLRERKVPDGLRLHVLDIWVDELVGALGTAQNLVEEDAHGHSEDGAALLDAIKAFMTPVDKLSKEALSKSVKTKAKEVVKVAAEKLS